MLLYHVEKKEKKRHPSVCTPATSKKRKKNSGQPACGVSSKIEKKRREQPAARYAACMRPGPSVCMRLGAKMFF